MKELFFTILICSYNNANWVKKNLDSVFCQTYPHYRVLYINDCSTDTTATQVHNYLTDKDIDKKCNIITTTRRHYKLYNMFHAIHKLCNNNEIIVELDGDDWFLHEKVLENLAQMYKNTNIWMTYGGFVCWPQTFNYLKTTPLTKKEFKTKNIRSTCIKQFCFMALRSFYAGLFKKIEKKDLMASGTFFPCCSDVATMLPMLEMAQERSCCLSEPVYLYNTNTGSNDFQINRNQQQEIMNTIAQKQQYKRLEKL